MDFLLHLLVPLLWFPMVNKFLVDLVNFLDPVLLVVVTRVVVVVSVTFYSARKKTIDHQPGSELYIFKPIPSNEEE